ncbi:MAG: hypothetical protein V1721_01730 [Pseudomonadota bacterium]
MKIIKRIEDDVVLYAGDDLVLDKAGAQGKGWRSSIVTKDTAILLDVDSLPPNFIGGGWAYIGSTWISNAEGDAHAEKRNIERTAVVKAALKNQALDALTVTDLVALRCVKAGMPFPSDWWDYVTDLRAIVNGDDGPLPKQPAYPGESR